MLVIVIFEMLFYVINEQVCAVKFEAVDAGRSMYVHTFGALFGLACATKMAKGKKDREPQKISGEDFNLQMKALMGTIFLWCYWPAFNCALSYGNSQMRVMVNTVLALCGSLMAGFGASALHY